MAFRRLTAVLFSLCSGALFGCGDDSDSDPCGECERITTDRLGFEAGEACIIGCTLLDCRTGARSSGLCDDGGVPPDTGELDLGPPDAAASPLPSLGDACESDSDCKTANEVCVSPGFREGSGLGGADDPIVDHPEGEDTFVPVPFFPGGYCAYSYPEDGFTARQCNLRDEDQADTICGDFSTCVDLFGLDTDENTSDFVPGFCALDCHVDDLSDNDDCRDGYECLLVEEVCLPGCQSDDECRITREETNGIAGLQTPADCAAGDCTPADCEDADPADPAACSDPASNFDRLVYDTTSEAVCDPSTFRCTGRPSTATAAGGDPCTEDRQCEPGGACLTEAEGWPGGSCTKVRCDLEDNSCANDGVCQEVGGVHRCLEGCTVGGVDPGSDPATWVAEGSARTTCREGYGCTWGGEADQGACMPVDYEPAVTEPNVGLPCESDADCFSPFGQGSCLQPESSDTALCTVLGCAAPWFTSEGELCGDGAECIVWDPFDPTTALCVRVCERAEECASGFGCVDVSADAKGCFPGCATDGDCRVGQRCDMPGTPGSACVPE